MFDVFRWIASFPRFGSAPPDELVKQVEQLSSVRVGGEPVRISTTEELDAQAVFRKYGMRPGLLRMQEILHRLGDPHLALRFIHIAGTNGKGSTAAFLSAMLEAAGLKTGLYTSPYLTEFHDRMAIDGTAIATEQLATYADLLKPIVDEVTEGPFGTPTEFEIVTLLAILYFRAENVDVVVWETGLGGRLDATNIVQPIATIITNIGLEHTEILGSTVELIAKEKSGILKPNVPLFTAAAGNALCTIESIAVRQNVPVYVYGRDFESVREWTDESGQRCIFRTYGDHGLFDVFGVTMQMHGPHQAVNAALSIAAYQWCMQHVFFMERILPVKSGDNRLQQAEFIRNTVRVGVRMMNWAGRFEVIQKKPLWILDGAHNPHGAKALAQTLQEWQNWKRRRIILIVGILRDKDVANILNPVLQHVTVCIAAQPDNPRAMPAEHLADRIRSLWNGRLYVATSIFTALEKAKYELDNMEETFADDTMVVCMGSLYTISEARKDITNRIFF